MNWYFNEVRIPFSQRIVQQVNENIHSLIIRKVITNDFGFYNCNAINQVGSASVVIELSGVANPAVFKKESHPISNTSYSFSWEVDSYSSIIEYQFWFRRYKVRQSCDNTVFYYYETCLYSCLCFLS